MGDTALCRYYKLNNIPGYINEDGIGKFKEFCTDNGYDDDIIMSELMQENIDLDYMMLSYDFDENLMANDGDDRAQNVCDLLRECLQNPDAFPDNSSEEELFMSDLRSPVTDYGFNELDEYEEQKEKLMPIRRKITKQISDPEQVIKEQIKQISTDSLTKALTHSMDRVG